MKRTSNTTQQRLKIIFIGTSCQFSIAALKAIIATGCDVLMIVESVREKNTEVERKSILKKYCKNAYPYIMAYDVNSNEIEVVIKNSGCNLICIASCCQLLKSNILNLPLYGVVNAHPALLPQYKGPDPSYWIFYYGEKESGVTIHKVDLLEDNGDIIVQTKFEVPFGITQKKYNKVLCRQVALSYKEALTKFKNGTIKCSRQRDNESLVRARRTSHKDYFLKYSEWDVKRVFHFLRGTAGANYLYNDNKYNYFVVGYSNRKHQRSGLDIICNNGTVYIIKTLNIRSFLGKIKRNWRFASWRRGKKR